MARALIGADFLLGTEERLVAERAATCSTQEEALAEVAGLLAAAGIDSEGLRLYIRRQAREVPGVIARTGCDPIEAIIALVVGTIETVLVALADFDDPQAAGLG